MPEANIQFDLAHVLFMDVVGYSTLLIDDQREVLRDLNAIVRGTEQFRAAEAQKKLISLPPLRTIRAFKGWPITLSCRI